MKLPKIENLSDKSLWALALVLSSISFFATIPIWMLLRKRKREDNENEKWAVRGEPLSHASVIKGEVAQK